MRLLFLFLAVVISAIAQQTPPLTDESNKQAKKLDVLIEQWKAATEKGAEAEVAILKDKDPTAAQRMQYLSTSIQSTMLQFKRHLANDDYNNAKQTASQLFQNSNSPEARKLSEMILSELDKKAGEFENIYVEQADALVKKTGEQCLAAKNEKDLDALLAELSQAQNRNRDYNNARLQRAKAKIDAAIQFTVRWQDYLAQESAGNQLKAQQIIKTLAELENNYPILPRSELLSRLPVSKPEEREEKSEKQKTKEEISIEAGKIISNLSKLEDLDSAIESIQKLEWNKRPIESVLQDLLQLKQRHLDYQMGNYQLFSEGITARNTHPWKANLNRLHIYSLKLSIIKQLGYTDITVTQTDEVPTDWLQRLIVEAVKKGDWERTARMMEIYRLIAFSGRSSPTWLTGDIAACQAYLAGERLEKAGQYMPAILSYQKVLKFGEQNAPLELATERIKILSKEHPETANDANKVALLQEAVDSIRQVQQKGTGGREGAVAYPNIGPQVDANSIPNASENKPR